MNNTKVSTQVDKTSDSDNLKENISEYFECDYEKMRIQTSLTEKEKHNFIALSRGFEKVY